jgi:hypothetical protein
MARRSWRWSLRQLLAAACAVALVAACNQVSLEPAPATSAPPEATAIPDIAPYAGDAYSVFAARADTADFSLEALGLSEADQARFGAASADERPGVLVGGGGARALVFYGCAARACAEGVAVVAIDAATGDAFVGVRDSEGAEALVRNERLEALLRLNAASGRWDDPNPRPALSAP